MRRPRIGSHRLDRSVKPLLVASCLAALVMSCAAPTTVRRPEGFPVRAPDIRVLLAEGRESAMISAGEGLIVSASGGIKLLESPGKCALRISGGPSNIELMLEPSGNVATAQEEVSIIPRGAAALSFEDVTYAGSMSIVIGADGKLMLVNTVPLETYLEGVLPHEMGDPGADGFDALKAQAVAARTYALERINIHTADRFDVYAGVRDQVYQGLKGKNNHASAAVSDTRGMVAGGGNGHISQVRERLRGSPQTRRMDSVVIGKQDLALFHIISRKEKKREGPLRWCPLCDSNARPFGPQPNALIR